MTAGLEGLRVLVVEDEAIVSMLIEDYLDALGCLLAGSASRLDDALHKASTLNLDAALLDVNLTGTLSYPVAQVLRERGVHVVFATGYGEAGLPPEFLGTPVLAKPFRLEQLAQALGGRASSAAGS